MFNNVGAEPSNPISYDPGSQHHHLAMSMLVGDRYRLDIDIERDRDI